MTGHKAAKEVQQWVKGVSLDGKSPAKERQEDTWKSKPSDCSDKLANRQQN